jgi:GT2 family glycosyltransferase/acetyltransferase-like isoleucine patch superfamily enzyme
MLTIGESVVAASAKFYVDETATCIVEDGVEIRDNVVIECGAGGYLKLSCGTVVNCGVWINGSGRIPIGKNVLIAPNSSITSSSHRYDRKIPIKDQGLKLAEVRIGDDVWIGANVSILAGAEIGDGAIVSANSVVKYNVSAMTIAAGNPAVKVGQRKFKCVVFYTLPLILRMQPTLFSSIVDLYMPLADKFSRDGWECVFVGSDQLKNEYPGFRHRWVSPEEFDCSYPDARVDNWLADWTRILRRETLGFHDDFIQGFLNDIDPDLVFCWNYDGRLEEACVSRGIPLIFNELGMLRPPNSMGYYSDSKGVNARSSFKDSYLAFTAGHSADECVESSDRLTALEKRYARQGRVSQRSALILLQVHDDSNVIMGSPYASMKEYVQHISNVLAGSAFDIVVKPHPLDAVPDLPEGVLVADKAQDITELVAAADAVFTLNSSAGFEAALAGKCVYVLGVAPYAGLGLTIDVADPANLRQSWQSWGAEYSAPQSIRSKVLEFAEAQYFLTYEQFCEPSSHLLRLKPDDDELRERKVSDPDLESYRQQSYISWLESKNKELNTDLDLLNNELFQVNGRLFELEKKLETLQQGKLQSDCSAEKDSFVKDKLFGMRFSKKSLVTRCLSRLRLSFSSPKAALRPLYQKFPFLARVRVRLGLFSRGLRRRMLAVIYAKNNLKALQDLTEHRFSHVVSSLEPDERPTIDISIVTYNSSKWVDGFFESLKKQSYPCDKINLFFVDNGSSDATVEELERWQAELSEKVACFNILRGENIGFGAGHDRAIAMGCADYFLVSNIDIQFSETAIEQIVAHALSQGQDDVASWEMRQAPFEHPKYYDPVTLDTNWSSHACILIRRAAYARVGGYEEQIFMYGEDVELSYRFRSYGYRLKFCPSAVVYHYTYEHENQVKPIQYVGSTAANAYIRLRYGSLLDKVGGVILQFLLMLRPQVYPGSRLDVMRSVLRLLKKAPHFLKGKGPEKGVSFPFRGFDYEMVRDGAFWHVGTPIVESPLVTIVTRTYRKREEFLRQSIMSVLNQTYRNIELIVVEDGGATMRSLVEKTPSVDGLSVRFFGLEKVGRSVTGNHGLEMATGRYCMFLDDDDLLFPDHVEILVAALLKEEHAVAAYSLAMEVGTVAGGEGRYVEVSHETNVAFKQDFDYETLLDHNYIPIQSILFKRDLYTKRGGFETDMSNLEDWNLWLRYAYKNRFCYVPKTTSLFRTPADPKVRLDRHKQLHDAYYIAKSRALKSCEAYQ